MSNDAIPALEQPVVTGTHTHGMPAWLRPSRGEHRWPAALAILAAIGLQVALPKDLAFHPQWALPGLELVIFVVLLVANPTRINRESAVLRFLGLALISVASLANAWSAALLVTAILRGRHFDAPSVLLTGGAIWLTNVIVFALWYWEFDRGGPASRANVRSKHPDFLFTEMTVQELVRPEWEPTFVDYLFLSFTNAAAFSPTDTLPLTAWAKLSMMFQAGVSLGTVALVVARAINLLT
jgi:hypothetical protein